MSDKVIVTSGLSKAYGIPGVRIGWIVGPPPLVETCWSQHDYLTIGPNKLSDMVARVAVQRREPREAVRAARAPSSPPTCRSSRSGRPGFGDLLEFNRPRAGAMTLVRYRARRAEPRAVRTHPRRAEHARGAGQPRRPRGLPADLVRRPARTTSPRGSAGSAPCCRRSNRNSRVSAGRAPSRPHRRGACVGSCVEQRLLGWLARYGLQAVFGLQVLGNRRAARSRRNHADDGGHPDSSRANCRSQATCWRPSPAA